MLVRRVLAVVVAGLLSMGFGCMDSPEATPPPAGPVPGPADPAAGAAATIPVEDLKAVADGNNAFAVELYKRVAAETDRDVVLSPLSIRTALALTYAGARGRTADEMREVLHFKLPDDRLHAAIGATTRRLTEGPPNKAGRAEIANALWLHDQATIAESFRALADRHYAAGLNRVDFRSSPAAIARINGWVHDRTHGMIADLVSKDEVTELTRLVLTNAVHFKGDWARPFPAELTKDAPFHVGPGRTVPVRMMHARHHLQYADADGVRLLVLPYNQPRQAALIVLPTKNGELADIERSLTPSVLARWLSATRGAELCDVTLMLPAFRVGGGKQALAKYLDDAGMRTTFRGGKADFSGFGLQERVCISEVVHKVVVETDEKGTVAAAATAVVTVVMTSAVREVKRVVLTADRPFLFLVYDRDLGLVEFICRISMRS